MIYILNEIDRALREQGYAGSTRVPKIVYLAATTRFFENPVSLAVFGPSGVGKSYAVDSGLQFIPPKEIERLSGMSEKALPYLGSERPLKNRVLFLGEASGMADGDGRAFLRQLLSDGRINYLTVQKTNSGLKGEKLPTVEGPVCFMMTTTANRIHHEDQSRMLILNLDYDRDTIRQSLLNAAAGRTRTEIDIDLSSWFEVQQNIKENPVDVKIPYAERLAEHMPIDNIKVQRDFPKVLSMIKACSLVHQDDRDRDQSGSVLASREDYEAIYDLLAVPLSQGLEADVTPGVRTVVEGIEQIGEKDGSARYNGISQSKLAEFLKADRSSVLRNVNSAINSGYLFNQSPGKGREATLVLGERKLSSSDALPRPGILFEDTPSEQVHKWTGRDDSVAEEPAPRIPLSDDMLW